MRWNLSLFLFDVFLNSFVLVFGVEADALGKAFFPLWAMADVDQDRVCFTEVTKSESGEADLDYGSIVLDLDWDRLLGDHLSDLCLLDEVLGLLVSIVEGVMVALS